LKKPDPIYIGCGNELRGDDVAGLLVARHLRSLGLKAFEHTGDGLSLIQLWKPSSAVVLVDAFSPAGNPGRVRIWDVKAKTLEPYLLRFTTHSFGVAEAIETARLLDNLPKQLLLYGIEGSQFELGTPPSVEVMKAVEKVVEMILERHASLEV
jgi:hydrogenase maturation protease